MTDERDELLLDLHREMRDCFGYLRELAGHLADPAAFRALKARRRGCDRVRRLRGGVAADVARIADAVAGGKGKKKAA